MTADQPREDAIAAGPDAREAFIRRIVALTPGNFTDDFLFLLDRLDEARAAMTTPREDAIAALAEWPCQRYNPPHDCGVISGNAPLPCGPCTARAALTRTAPMLDVRVATVEAKFVQHMAESHGATTERRESQPAPADPTADPRADIEHRARMQDALDALMQATLWVHRTVDMPREPKSWDSKARSGIVGLRAALAAAPKVESVRAASERLGIPIGHVRDYPHRFAPFEDDGLVQRAHVACCWCGEHHEEGR